MAIPGAGTPAGRGAPPQPSRWLSSVPVAGTLGRSGGGPVWNDCDTDPASGAVPLPGPPARTVPTPAPPVPGARLRRPPVLSRVLPVSHLTLSAALAEVLSSTFECLLCPRPEVQLLREERGKAGPSADCWHICVEGPAPQARVLGEALLPWPRSGGENRIPFQRVPRGCSEDKGGTGPELRKGAVPCC